MTIQSKKILRETIEIEMGMFITPVKINGKTAKIYKPKVTSLPPIGNQ